MSFSFLQPLRWLLLVAVFLLSAGGRVVAQAPAWQWANRPIITPYANIYDNNLVVDAAGNVYMTGTFVDTTRFGTTTLVSAGDGDVFVAKLTSSGTYQWVASVGGTGAEGGVGLAVDGSGNVVVTGGFRSPTLTFGTTTLTNAGGSLYDVFVAKLTPTGDWQWATSVGNSSSNVISKGIAVDGSGNVVVTGDFSSPALTFGTVTLASAGSGDVFVAKLTPAGAWQWATHAGGIGSDYSADVAVDGSGNVVVTGGFSSPTLTVGTTTLTNANAGSPDIFVAKLTPAGAWQWATHAGGNGYEAGASAAVDGSGNVVVTGAFSSPTLTLGTTTLTNLSGALSDVFVAKLTPGGAWQWATLMSGSDSDFSSCVAVDGSGNVVVTGEFRSPTLTVGTTTLTNADAANPGSGLRTADIFVAKLTPAGNWQWATRVGGGGRGTEISGDIAVDGSGSVVVTGYFSSSTITLGATTLTGGGIFLASLSPTTGLPNDTPADQPPLTLTPNPARTSVQLTGATGPTATLLDALGRVVGTWPLEPTTSNLDISAVPAGLYLLRAGGATRRLVVE